MSKFIIGLTGGIASGKSTVARLFQNYGITIIDADDITRELCSPNTTIFNKIVKKFGVEILNTDQTLNRAKLRKIIFQDKKARLWLEQLLHPEVKKIMKQRAKQANSLYCILVIPLLLETQFPPKTDRILVVDAPEQLQIQRLKQQGHLSDTEIQSILKSQASRQQRLKKADDVILNDGNLEQLEKQVHLLHQKYCQQQV
ncbi:MAG: dephospho-CoA kinase [Gammaproteobacteria bacterium]|nr:dephospho-CoA kinase [Gammaproteobacteria bacterium]